MPRPQAALPPLARSEEIFPRFRAEDSIFLRDLMGINIRGGDVVEVSPPFDSGNVTAIAGAHVAVDICSLL